MGKHWDELPEGMQRFISKQKLFFVATAPSGAEGHINVSPKGYGNTFALINSKKVAFLDLAGSGIETLAHVQQNGRITFQFLNLEAGAPCILRLWCKAKAYERGTPEFDHWLHTTFSAAAQQPDLCNAMRSIIVADIYECARSCGYAVPIYEFKQERDAYRNYFKKVDPAEQLVSRKANCSSLDGIPGLAIPDPTVYTNVQQAEDSGGAKGAASDKAKSSVPLVNVTAASSSSNSLVNPEDDPTADVVPTAAPAAADGAVSKRLMQVQVSTMQPYLSHVLVVVLTLLVSNVASLLVAAA
jgi:hypothetical protein